MGVQNCAFFVQAEDGIRDYKVTGVQTCSFFFQAEDGIRDYKDWSSDVCSSDLRNPPGGQPVEHERVVRIRTVPDANASSSVVPCHPCALARVCRDYIPEAGSLRAAATIRNPARSAVADAPANRFPMVVRSYSTPLRNMPITFPTP